MLEIADVLRAHAGAYLRRYGSAVLPSHHRAIDDLVRCRTPAMGGHVYACDHCGHTEYVYHSCKNRSCPKCHAQDTATWISARRSELLPVPHFHLVFTLPGALHTLVRSNQKRLYAILMKTAAESLQELAADPKYLGGQIGILAVLHTWTRTLHYHPHVHCLVPAGGVSDDGTWHAARNDFLVPVRALSIIFRAKFLTALRRDFPRFRIPRAARHKKWVVYCKPSIAGTDRLLDYLGRYVHRVAICNTRILTMSRGEVTIRHRSSVPGEWQTLSLPIFEFIRRFLQHVLPRGFHKVRYYGLWAPANKQLRQSLQIALATEIPSAMFAATVVESQQSTAPATQPARTCPRCQNGQLVLSHIIPRILQPP